MSPRQRLTTTGGRTATTRHIFGERVLSVGMPINQPAPAGWRWVPLTEVATMESGHTPSREHPEYWNGDIPWLGVRDAGKNHGTVIDDTSEHTNQLGVDNSSARLLPAGTVCLSRGGTVGYVVMLGRPMCTSQGFANWICGPELDARFLMHLLLSEKRGLDRFAIGTTIQTIYYPDLKALHVCIPSLSEQQRIVRMLDEAFEGVAVAKANTEKNLQNVRVLFESHLHAVLAKGANGWKSAPLNEICDLISRGISPSYAEAGDTVVLNQRCVRNHQVDFGPSRRHDGNIKKVAEIRLLQPGDVLVNSTGVGTLGRVGQVMTLPQRRTTVDSHITILRPRADLFVQKFFGYMLIAIEPSIALLGQGSGGQTELAKSALSAMHVTWPTSHAEQKRKIANLDALVGASDVLASGYLKKLAALDDLQKSLLSQAFLGELEAA